MENVMVFLSKGGIIMYPLLLASVIAMAIVIEKSISMRK